MSQEPFNDDWWMWTEKEKLFLQVIIAQHYCCSKHSVLERVQQKP